MILVFAQTPCIDEIVSYFILLFYSVLHLLGLCWKNYTSKKQQDMGISLLKKGLTDLLLLANTRTEASSITIPPIGTGWLQTINKKCGISVSRQPFRFRQSIECVVL